jgi:mannose-6-phosphate isomerase-like protein (cupin superfamily)
MSQVETSHVLTPYGITPTDGETLGMADGSTVRILASGTRTGSVLGLIEVTYPIGRGFPMHIHHKEDETHYVLEGKVLFVSEGVRIEAGPGTFFFGPRGVAHGFRSIGEVPAKFIEGFLPAGLEELFGAPMN